MQRVRIRLGIDGDRTDTKAFCCASDTAGDLAAVGYEDLVEHRNRMRSITWPSASRAGACPGKLQCLPAPRCSLAILRFFRRCPLSSGGR